MQQLLIADGYFKKGEFQKALLSYKKLYDKKPFRTDYIYKMVSTHQQLEDYDASEKLIDSALQKRANPSLLIELGYNYQLKDSIDIANKLYQEAINFIDERATHIYAIGQRFEQHSLSEQAIMAYERAAPLLPERNFSIQLARIYGDQGNIEKMFSNYIDYIAYRPENLNNIKRSFNDFVSENKDNENNGILRRTLLLRIQKQPDTYWYELLSWLYVQEKQYSKSFAQEKALYRRNPESLDRIIDLAITAMNDDQKDVATTIFNYILEASQDTGTVLLAHQYLLEIETDTASKKDLKAIDNKYQDLFNTYGKFESTISLQLAYGNFLAFYYDQPETASAFLKQTSQLDVSPYQKATIKLKLADILVLQEKFNEALIYYSQIHSNLKNSTIAQQARFKVAKTSYYKGDFEWAESQLKILKSSTSQLIANDALDLKLLISDNKYEDSTQTALKYYAKADLLAFQNKTDEAISLLDKILTEHKGESITDQTLYQQAKLYEQQRQYEKAAINYQTIIKDYREDILIDDAYYYLAELYNNYLAKPEEAKPLYEKIIFEYEDSIYFVEARKKFRMLRGDAIN
ncbi:tetratricopeptide repeat protein [Winogradskyella sp. E313]|uniref:Tetratricopeptide repeat protein n=2 Tax=Winogradskyella immobilis TaxID=2816852 RepID=A0ABS8ENA3_9FLAO|nr:tetratricopeptide repeat protein [Winogradskyella immobilis]